MAKSALEPPTAKQVEIRGKLVDKSWHLKVLRTPLEILPDSTGKRVGAVSLQVNEVPSSFFFVGQRSVHTFGKKNDSCRKGQLSEGQPVACIIKLLQLSK
jgi:hypothetical protein